MVAKTDFETTESTGVVRVTPERLFDFFALQLVRIDGRFGALAVFGPKPEWGSVESVQLPVGTYAVALHSDGLYANDGLDIALQMIADDGGHEALGALPTIEIRAGKEISLELSVEEVECATREFVHAALFESNSVEALWS